jgi:hypothetical protein
MIIFRNIVIAVAAVLVVVYGSVALYRGSWALTNANAARSYALAQKNANREQHIIQHGVGMQSGLISDYNNQDSAFTGITVQLVQVSAAQRQPLIDQRLAIANKMCADAAGLDSLGDIGAAGKTWVQKNCTGSVVSVSSSLRKGS